MKSGTAVYAEFQRLVEQQRQELLAVRQHWQRSDEQVRRLVAERGAVVLELARHYLPDLSRERAEAVFQEIRTDLQRIVDRQERQRQVLSERLQRLQQQAGQVDARLQQVNDQLEKQVSAREQKSQLLAERLAGHAEFSDQSAALFRAQEELERVRQRLDELQIEVREKLPEYQRCPFFQYLQRVKFGKSEYQTRGWQRWFDRRVAELVDYPQAVRSYEYLLRAPDLVQREVERLATELIPLTTRVQQIQQQLAQEVGLTEVLRTGERLGRERDELVQSLGEQQELMQQCEHQLQELQSEENPFHLEALVRLRQWLERTELSVLQTWAAATPSPRDDELVSQIQTLTKELQSLEPELQRSESSAKQLEQATLDLEFLLRRFRQSNFDAPRSRFSDALDLGRLLRQIAGRALSRDGAWEAIRQAQHFEPTWVEESARQIGRGTHETLANPAAGMLLHVLAEVASAALHEGLRQHQKRSAFPSDQRGARRIDLPDPAWERQNSSKRDHEQGKRQRRPRGFSRGEGF